MEQSGRGMPLAPAKDEEASAKKAEAKQEKPVMKKSLDHEIALAQDELDQLEQSRSKSHKLAELKAKLEEEKKRHAQFQAEKEKALNLPDGPLQVVAKQPGFYGNQRYAVGQKFKIEGKHHLGLWMDVIS